MEQGGIYRALTIAGSDSGGGAGIQADLKTFAALGVYGCSAITALTAQNTVEVTGIHNAPPEFVAAQIDAVATDIGADAVKTGMLSSAAIVEVVSAKIREYGFVNLVADPVMISKGGAPLLLPEAVRSVKERLIPLARVVTPNLHEAEALTGIGISGKEEMKEAARAIHGMGCGSVVVKGGHLEGEAVDLLFDGRDFFEFPGPRIETPNTHGTGCTFASAVAAYLARGFSLVDAVAGAKEFISGAIKESLAIGAGHGPTHHFFRLYRVAGVSLKKGE